MSLFKNLLPGLSSVFASTERSLWIVVTVFCCLLLTACPAKSKADGPPTQSEVKASIERNFRELYGVDYGGAKLDKVLITFTGPAKIGSTVKTQVGRGEDARPVWPVKIPVRIQVTYSNNPSGRDLERGLKSDDVFFFYKDAFDAWTFRTGSL